MSSVYKAFLRQSRLRRNRIKILSAKGLSFAAIGRKLGISRQRVRVLANDKNNETTKTGP